MAADPEHPSPGTAGEPNESDGSLRSQAYWAAQHSDVHAFDLAIRSLTHLAAAAGGTAGEPSERELAHQELVAAIRTWEHGGGIARDGAGYGIATVRIWALAAAVGALRASVAGEPPAWAENMLRDSAARAAYDRAAAAGAAPASPATDEQQLAAVLHAMEAGETLGGKPLPASPAVREAAELRLALRWALSKIGQPTRRVAGPLGNAEHFDAYQRAAALAAEGEPPK